MNGSTHSHHRNLAKRLCITGLVFLVNCVIVVFAKPLHAQDTFEQEIYFSGWAQLVGLNAYNDGSSVLLINYRDSTSGGGLVTKLKSDGSVHWSMAGRGVAGDQLVGYPAVTASKEVLYLAMIDSGIMAVKLDSLGNFRFRHCFRTGYRYAPACVTPLSDGNYMLAIRDEYQRLGVVQLLLKVNPKGEVVWGKRIVDARTNSNNMSIAAMTELPDGSIVCVGSKLGKTDGGTFVDLITYRFDSSGTLLYQGAHSSLPKQSLRPFAVLATPAGGYIIAGMSFGNGNKSIIAFFDSSNQVQVCREIQLLSGEVASSVQLKSDGSTLVSTTTFGSGSTHLLEFSAERELTKVVALAHGQLSVFETTAFLVDDTRMIVGANIIPSTNNERIHYAMISTSLEGCDLEETLAIMTTLELHPETSDSLDFADTTVTRILLPVLPRFAKIPVTHTLCSTSALTHVTSMETQPLLLFPNPVSEQNSIMIAIPGSLHGRYELVMRDLSGHELYHLHNDVLHYDTPLQLPTAGLASGIYIVELLDGNSFANVWRGKVVVE